MTGTALALTTGTRMTTPTQRRNDDVMDASTAARIAASVPDETSRAYHRQWEAFVDWCATTDRTALPATPTTVAVYVSHLADRDLSPASLDQAIAVIRRFHRESGYTGQPDTAAARDVLRAHRRAWSDGGHLVREAPPVALDQLRAMVEASDPKTVIGLRDRALLVLGFSLMARRSELAALDLADVREVPEGLLVRIRKSKTDQEARGAEIAVPFGSRPDTCPVRAVRAWRAELADAGVTSGPLLRSVSRHGRIGDGITGKGVSLAIRAAAGRARLTNADAFTGHSLRAGGATAAAKAGVPTGTIARHGRWSPTSPVVNKYVRTVDRWRDNAMADVGL